MRAFFLSISCCVMIFATDPLMKFRKGEEAFKARELANAQTLFQEFIKESPYEIEVRKAWYYLTLVSQLQSHYHEAIARANITLERYSTHQDKIELRIITGECLYKVNAHARAAVLLAEIAKVAKGDAFQYRIAKTLGFINHEARRYQAAIQNLRTALNHAEKLNATDATDKFEIHRRLGLMYADDITQTEGAVKHLQSAIALGEKSHEREVKNLLLTLRKVSLRRINRLSGLPDDTIADIRVDGDDIYVATWSGGLVRFLRSRERLEKISLPSPQLRGLYVDFDDIYVASYDGVYRLQKKSGKITTLSDEDGELKLGQKTIKDDRYIYFSTLNRGLIQYDTIKRKITRLAKSSWVGSNQVYAIDADIDHVAVGTVDRGAVILNKKSGEATHIGPGENGLRSENVKAIALDGRYVHIGTHNDGVYTFDLEQKKLTRLNLEIPFPSAFARRDHELFIGTSGQGVRVLNRNDMSVERLSAVEGLASNEVQILRVEGDFLWIGYMESGIDVLYRPQREK